MLYKVISGDDPLSLSKAVNKHLDDGWELYGNLCIASCSTEGYELPNELFAQAMIKK